MSWHATSAVKRHSEARGGARLLLLILADYANDWGMCWPKVETLAHGCRVDVRTVTRNIDVLAKSRRVEGEEHPPELAVFPRPGTSNVYVLLLPGLDAPSKKDAEEFADLVGADRASDFLSGVTFANRNVPRTTKNDQRARAKSKDVREAGQNDGGIEDAAEPDDLGFQGFWQQYPRRDGKRIGRGQAEAAWRRMTDEQRAAALVGVIHYAAAVQDGITIAKDAFRWLRHKAYEDWQTPAVPDRGRRGAPPPVNPNDAWAGEEQTA